MEENSKCPSVCAVSDEGVLSHYAPSVQYTGQTGDNECSDTWPFLPPPSRLLSFLQPYMSLHLLKYFLPVVSLIIYQSLLPPFQDFWQFKGEVRFRDNQDVFTSPVVLKLTECPLLPGTEQDTNAMVTGQKCVQVHFSIKMCLLEM